MDIKSSRDQEEGGGTFVKVQPFLWQQRCAYSWDLVVWHSLHQLLWRAHIEPGHVHEA